MDNETKLKDELIKLFLSTVKEYDARSFEDVWEADNLCIHKFHAASSVDA